MFGKARMQSEFVDSKVQLPALVKSAADDSSERGKVKQERLGGKRGSGWCLEPPIQASVSPRQLPFPASRLEIKREVSEVQSKTTPSGGMAGRGGEKGKRSRVLDSKHEVPSLLPPEPPC